MAILTAAVASSGSREQRQGAILGCTPEYREVMRSNCVGVHLFDSSAAFKNLSDSIVGEHEREVFVQGNWLETLPEFKGRFSVICSHFTHGNLPYIDRSKFFRLISETLTDDGIFFDAIFDPQRTYSIDHLRWRFSNTPINLITANEFNACALFQSELSSALGVVDIAACYEWLDALRDDSHLSELIDYTKRVTKPSGVWYYSAKQGPETFGYKDVFEELARIEEPPENAFGANAYLLISRRRRT